MSVKTKQIALNVLLQEGDFTIESPDSLSVKAGETVGFTIDVTPLMGFSGSVKFTVSGGPAGMTVGWENGVDTWSPSGPANLQCNLSIPLDNALVGAYTLMLTGTTL
jgi:hypothetical protein